MVGDGQAPLSAGPVPLRSAGYASRLVLGWASKLLAKGKRVRKDEGRELELHDLWDLPEENMADNLYDRFQRVQESGEIEEERDDAKRWTRKRHLITLGVWRVIRRDVMVSGILRIVSLVSIISYPIILNKVLLNVELIADQPEDQVAFQLGFMWIFVFGAALTVTAISQNMAIFHSMRSVATVRSVLCTAVYRKVLRISTASRQTMTAGEIVNLMQLDAEGVAMVALSIHSLWTAPVQIIGFVITLWYYIDWATFTSFGVFAVMAPIIYLTFSLLVSFQTQWARRTDARVLQTNEVLQSMQGVKMGGWELNFAKVIKSSRDHELRATRNTAIVRAINSATMRVLPTITAIVALSAYATGGLGVTDAATLFTALAAFNLLRRPLQMLPNALSSFGEGVVRRRRLAKFLSLRELDPRERMQPAVATSGSNTAVQIKNGEFHWADTEVEIDQPTQAKAAQQKAWKNDSKKQPQTDPVPEIVVDDAGSSFGKRPVLSDINVTFEKGLLVGVCAPVAAGKSSLCAAIIGEMHKTAGHVQVDGSIAYAAQTPWIYHASVRDNILFGEPYDDERYRATLVACQLVRDLELLTEGDQTMVGEQGINLSGGQKARLSLARAAYSQREIIILDDPLSALDPGVAAKVFNECIVKLLAGRTRILVTNMLNVLPMCDHVLLLHANEGEPGRIVEQGTYAELEASGKSFSELVQASHGAREQEQEQEEQKDEDGEGKPSEKAGTENEDAAVSKLVKGTALMQKEERLKGAVAWSHYMFYIRSGGGSIVAFMVLFLFLIQQGAQIGNQAWVAYWSSDDTYKNNELSFYLAGYGLTGFGFLVLILSSTLSLMLFGVRASRSTHNQLLDSVLRAPISFFDRTPTGRIVSRFARDTNQIDKKLPESLLHFSLVVVAVLMSLAAIGVSTPLFLLIFPVLAPVYISILQYYRPTIRDIRRMESISRSPIYSHFSESISGLMTIRAYSSTPTFIRASCDRIDLNIRVFYHVIIAQIWLFIRLSLMGAVISVAAGTFAILAARAGSIPPGLAGLSLTLAITATDFMAAMVSSVSHVETSFNAVERVRHYIENIPHEKPFTSSNPPAKPWPSSGSMVIKDLKMRYRPDLPLVLKGLSLQIKGGERIGVIGRTGCGKSSFMLSLLRLVEPETCDDGSGSVIIDGVDVSQIGLHELRSKIGIVPQNPMLFSGTIRTNLDPFGVHTDDDMWKSLEACTLRECVEELGGIDSAVSEFGENLSQGQRQLLVLSRALLDDTRILLLDEATSSLDHATDALIQTTLRKNFAQATCITIAHRLLTVADSSRILVLDDGQMLEYDTPANLLQNPSSTFSRMVSELGPSMAKSLRNSVLSGP